MSRILFFIEKFGGGGAEKVLRNLVNHMDQAQFDITVQSVWPYEEGSQLAPGVKYKSVYLKRNRFTEVLYRIEAATGLLYQLHVKDNFDIECAFLEAGPTKIIAASTNRKSVKIAWVHCDLTKSFLNQESFVKKTSSWYDRFDRIVCVSQNVKESFDKLYNSRYRSVVLHNVVDDTEIKDKAGFDLPEKIEKNNFTIVSVGRLMYQKGYDMLLRAFKRLLDDGLQCDLWIAGDGEDRNKLELYINENNLGERVSLLGFLKNPYPVIASADLLVCSSRWEGFSTFATEGVILGKPIITTDCTGMRELLGDSKFGYIVPIDEEALYLGLREMITNENRRIHYSKQAAIRGKEFEALKLTKQIETFFLSEVDMK